MSTNSNVRDSRFVLQNMLQTDYTLSIVKADGGKLRFSSNLKLINNIDDTGSGFLRLTDSWDALPDVADMVSVVNKAYPGRTVLYSGEDGSYQPGCVYKCVPAEGFLWENSSEGSSAQLFKCVAEAALNIPAGEYLLISNLEGIPRMLFYCVESTEHHPEVRAASGYAKPEDVLDEDGASVPVYQYDTTTSSLKRTPYLNEILSTFHLCEITHADSAICQLFKIPQSQELQPTPAFVWQLESSQEDVQMTTFASATPSGKTCFLTSNPTCFDFGSIETGSDNITIVLDTSNLDTNKYYNSNILYFELGKELAITFNGRDGTGALFSANVVGDTKFTVGKYRLLVEVLPNGSVIVTSTKVGGAIEHNVNGVVAYGVRINGSSVSKIELTRGYSVQGDPVETINEVTTFTKMPCHDFKRCVMKDFTTGVPNYYLYPSDSRYRADGVTPADLTGADGDVMVELPKCYLRVTRHRQSNDTYALDYLISDAVIPDAPPGSTDGTLYNGPHPFFRIGGELELDGNGNLQYEKHWGANSEATGNLEDTPFVLRSPKNRMYVGAFQSVQCWHGPISLLSTVSANSSHAVEDVEASGSFYNGDNYPRMECGVPCGPFATEGAKAFSRQSTELRSIAPYRDGDMTYVGLPGVHVVFTTGDDSEPEGIMPGGCDAVFYCTETRNYVYQLTTDTVFKTGKPYYTRTWDGTDYIYTKASVKIGSSVPAGVYFVKTIPLSVNDVYEWSGSFLEGVTPVTYHYELKFVYNTGSTIGVWRLVKTGTTDVTIAETNEMDATTFTTLSGVFWNIRIASTSTLYAMGTTDEVYRLYGGPIHYGNHNAAFNWEATVDGQTAWDKVMAGNPNWSANFRPAIYGSNNDYHAAHGNGYISALNYYYSLTKLTLDRVGYCKEGNVLTFPNGKDSCTFEFDPNIADKAKCMIADPGDVWYGLTSSGTADQTCRIWYNGNKGRFEYVDAYGHELKDDDAPYYTGKKPSTLGVDSVTFIDKYNGFLDLQPTGFKPANTFCDHPVAINPARTIVPRGVWTISSSDPSEDNVLNNLYTRTSGGTIYRMGFDHARMRWRIFYGNTIYYYSNMLDPAALAWKHGTNVIGGYSYVRRNMVSSLVTTTNRAITIPFVTDLLTGHTLTLSYDGDDDTAYLSRTWSDDVYKIEFITNSDARKFPDNTLVRTYYGGCWVLAEYTTSARSAIKRVLVSDMDIISPSEGDSGAVVFRPVNPDKRNGQRTYNATTGATTNSTLVYESEWTLETRDGYYQIFFIDENGTLPQYINSKSESIKSAIIAALSAEGDVNGRWVTMKYSDSLYSTPEGVVNVSDSVFECGPWKPSCLFIGNPDNTTCKNNELVLKYQNVPLVTVKSQSSGKGYNAHARFKYYLNLMMLIDTGAFSISTSHTGTLFDSPSNGCSTFAGRTSILGNRTGDVAYDPQVDVSVPNSAFDTVGSTISGTSTKIVAWSYRGIENPTGGNAEQVSGQVHATRNDEYNNFYKGWFETTDLAGQYTAQRIRAFSGVTYGTLYDDFKPIFVDIDYGYCYNWYPTTSVAHGATVTSGTKWVDVEDYLYKLPLDVSNTDTGYNRRFYLASPMDYYNYDYTSVANYLGFAPLISSKKYAPDVIAYTMGNASGTARRSTRIQC